MHRVVDDEPEILCDFQSYFDLCQFLGNKLSVFYRIQNWARYLGIEAWLLVIIQDCIAAVESSKYEEIVINE